MRMQRIAVIGAGIAGLTVALRRASAGDTVVLFEAAAKVGGQIATESHDGFVVEHGAEGFVARSEAVPALAVEAGIADHVVEQLEQRSFRFNAGKLVELAPGEAGRLLGFQVASEELGRGIRSFWHGMAELPGCSLRPLVPRRAHSKNRACSPA
jgi:oxygen-dependent protoporphyrinogen oxidase